MTIGRLLPIAVAMLMLAMALPTQAAAPVPPPIPVIVDTDIGDDIDDAFALTLALSDPRLDVIGVTTAWGDTRTRVLLTRRLLAAMGRNDVPVAQGITTKGATVFTQKRWALGATDVSPAPDAVDFIRAQTARRPGKITLIELAPMTNLQALIQRDPRAYRRLKQVAAMGGSIERGYGDVGATPLNHPSPEYNIASAPSAFAAVLAQAYAVPLRLFPLDSTQIRFDEARRDRLFAYSSPTSDALTLLYHQWRVLNPFHQVDPTLFDVVPAAWLIDPSLCALTPMHVSVDAMGFTRADASAPPNAQVCLTSPGERVSDVVLSHLAPEPAP